MDNFIVSARKYRPNSWDTVVGQESITSTLRNAIKQSHLAQAYLFCGPRGVGKTTCARIFAKEINIAEGADPDQDFSFNIFELDAASNNSVEDIRSITDQVRIPPQVGKYRVFIIDEVHMLSQQAFNAFLKTLEEPPPHAIFILATTEKHKIIPTILSRCQIFDFNRIRIPDIAKHLAYIAEKEGVTTEADGLHIIAQKADGALRDALSIFDQIIAFAGNEITYQAVIDNLNILDYDYYFKVTDSLIKGDIPSCLLLFNEILNHGFDGHNFLNGLGEHLRNLMVCKDEGTVKLLEVGDTIKTRYLEQSAAVETQFLLQGLELNSKADVQYKASKNQRLLVELLLMQLCSLTDVGAEKKKLVTGT
jgi:DNA polymerase-3 subunit gamma/tau